MSNNRVEAVERALEILNCFTEDQSTLSLKLLAEKTGFYKSTILRLCGSLERYGYLTRQKDGQYRLGLALVSLGKIAQNSCDIGTIVRPIIESLRDCFNESVAFYTRSGNKRICLYRANANRAIRHQLEEGRRLPLEKGAAGQILLAYSGGEGEPFTTIRQQGWYTSLGERDPEVASVGVPVLTAEGKILAVLCISGLISRFTATRQRECAQALQVQAQGLAEQIDPQPFLDMS
ncbi:transcriptional regulator, IclR family [Desulfuromusa kysingii]|uniref:Transcriptional regulator, IclR family n=1 Tax=Desulfuromusa kysingii TaxID=37625 RepID=A0A1H4AX91_9BACT|nr:IclR family transcriptional regulator [Desulfuromusa kysingii]SEA40398.1 transcriptional regulator, IclR family [Desulfuromusa kysingii]